MIKDEINYDPSTGIFRWKVSRSGRIGGVNAIAGAIDKSTGYRRIRINGHVYRASRLAWYLVYGYWPKEIDHINRVKDDDRLANLREVTRSQNIINGPAYGQSGEKGVYWNKRDNRWQAMVGRDYKLYCLGYFLTKEEAIVARDNFLKSRGE